MNEKWRWLIVVIFAAAMAWVESAVVLYMRMLIDRLELYRQAPLPAGLGLGQTELIREAATLIMLSAVGWLAGHSWRDRLGYALLAFGVWDILYYLFLIPLTGWPQSPMDWDLLFLIPLPWWGPVLAPLTIAGLMILIGSLIIERERPAPTQFDWPLFIFSLGMIASPVIAMLRPSRLPTGKRWIRHESSPGGGT